MPKISAVGLFFCDKFEEIPKQKVINMSMLNKFHFSEIVIFVFSLFSNLIEEKSKEKTNLIDAVKNVRSITSEKIKQMHEAVDTTIKTLAWNSHARQTKGSYINHVVS